MRTEHACRVAVQPVAETDLPAAQSLAQSLKLSLLGTGDAAGACDLRLLVEGEDIALQTAGADRSGPVRVDFGGPAMRYRRRGGHNELLGRAVGIGKRAQLTVLDATAGLGRDGFVLADLGCQVVLYERHPVLAALLAAGLRRAGTGADPWLAEVSGRLELHAEDATGVSLGEGAVDVIYLDPMFPERRKSAAVKKEMALFQLLLQGQKDDGEALLNWALRQPVARVVVKRPLRAPPLGQAAPSHCVAGKAVRFDVHVLRALN